MWIYVNAYEDVIYIYIYINVHISRTSCHKQVYICTYINVIIKIYIPTHKSWNQSERQRLILMIRIIYFLLSLLRTRPTTSTGNTRKIHCGTPHCCHGFPKLKWSRVGPSPETVQTRLFLVGLETGGGGDVKGRSLNLTELCWRLQVGHRLLNVCLLPGSEIQDLPVLAFLGHRPAHPKQQVLHPVPRRILENSKWYRQGTRLGVETELRCKVWEGVDESLQ